ncbi:NADH dehydrogenase subunit J [Thermanaeromonas toyohensis ToBE]|uniref:NADH-quinone oxidoreductase subunit J n=1 Tax=Thermanaeromonas toyohensis ToBE TaxID=698762 RepID=A0A1W1VPS9_9FIRM|nr:NADH-quinone oxidoreductase subunit J [Thermanaeromonas toyohensis]SMB95382.1 NADH dehydrogenase subunit J [Thermanaeromonas toyohensis ToBE]
MAGNLTLLAFWVLSALIVASALAVVFLPNIVHSALYLVLSFIGVAGIYILLEAEFLAAVQVLVYVGAVSVLLIFGVMLTRRGNIRQSNLFNGFGLAAGVVSLALCVLIMLALARTPASLPFGTWPKDTVGALAEAFLGSFVLPFEVAAILLLVGIIGAILVAREVKEDK